MLVPASMTSVVGGELIWQLMGFLVVSGGVANLIDDIPVMKSGHVRLWFSERT